MISIKTASEFGESYCSESQLLSGECKSSVRKYHQFMTVLHSNGRNKDNIVSEKNKLVKTSF